MEQWITIPKTKQFYQVSNLGRVKSIERLVNYKDNRKPRLWPEKILASYMGTSGYVGVDLKIEGRVVKELVHRLVCSAFHKNPNDYGYVNHKDHNKINNNSDNLEWCNNSQNVRHSFDSGKHSGIGATHYRAKKIWDGKNTFGCAEEAAKFYKISKKTVYDMCRGYVSNRFNLSYL